MVAAGEVSATIAIKTVRTKGEQAGPTLKAEHAKAKSMGKAKVTAATISPKPQVTQSDSLCAARWRSLVTMADWFEVIALRERHIGGSWQAEVRRNPPYGPGEYRRTFIGPAWRVTVVSPLIPVPAVYEPDPEWWFVDPAGHVHAYDAAGAVPTLIRQTRLRHDEDGEPYTTSWLACLDCGANVEPGTRRVPGPEYREGPPSVEGECILPPAVAAAYDPFRLDPMEAADVLPGAGIRGPLLVREVNVETSRGVRRVTIRFAAGPPGVTVDLAALFLASGHQQQANSDGTVMDIWLT